MRFVVFYKPDKNRLGYLPESAAKKLCKEEVFHVNGSDRETIEMIKEVERTLTPEELREACNV